MKSKRSKSTQHTLMRLMAVGLLLSTSIQAEQASDKGRQQNAKTRTRLAIRSLQIGSGMTVSDQFALRAAYSSAMKRLDGDASCRALFDELNLDGLQALSRNHYQPAQSVPEKSHCLGGVAAATGVGLSQVLICERFKTLPRPSKVAVLIHEALHTAGLNEAPYDPRGKTSREITQMVKKACSL